MKKNVQMYVLYICILYNTYNAYIVCLICFVLINWQTFVEFMKFMYGIMKNVLLLNQDRLDHLSIVQYLNLNLNIT